MPRFCKMQPSTRRTHAFLILTHGRPSSDVTPNQTRWPPIRQRLEVMTHVRGTARWTAYRNGRGCRGQSNGYSFASIILGIGSLNGADILEYMNIFTRRSPGHVPYYGFPRDITVISTVICRIRPARPEHGKAPELADHIWEIMRDCWSNIPSNRNSINGGASYWAAL